MRVTAPVPAAAHAPATTSDETHGAFEGGVHHGAGGGHLALYIIASKCHLVENIYSDSELNP